MALETGTYISDLVSTNPTVSDNISQGDDHIRLLKATIKATFPNITGAVNPTQADLNKLTSSGSPQFSTIELGAASDTTISRVSAGLIAVEGGNVPLENRANTFTANQVIEVTDNTNAALRITQLGTGNALVVEDSTNPDSSPFVVDASGNVGIGTASPVGKLHVSGSIVIGDVFGYGSGSNTMSFYPASTPANASTNSFLRFMNCSNGSDWLEACRINSAGNVGIGTSSPGTKLHVSSPTAVDTDIRVTNGVDVNSVDFGKQGSSAFGATAAGDGFLYSGTSLSLMANNGSGVIKFSSGGNTERMRIDSSGRVGIGVTPTEDFQVGLALKVRRQSTGDRLVAHADGNGGSQYFYYNASNLYGTVSDERSKENISAIDEQKALDFILRITPAQFSLKDQTDIQAGFIAQDVLAAAHDDAERSAVANVSSYSPDDPDCPMLGVSERPIVAMLVAAMKKQQATISALEARIDALEAA